MERDIILSQTTGYAITALGHLADAHGHPMFIKDIAEATEVPTAYLAKLVNLLARKGFLVTQRGIGGGVLLAASPESITFYDIAEALDDPLLQQRCMLGTAYCSDERGCPAHAFWKEHRSQHLEFLKQMTLRDIAEFELRQRQKALARTVEGIQHAGL